MRLSMSICHQTRPVLEPPAGKLNMNTFTPRWQKEKVVIIMGATGTGKSRLSIDVAAQFPAEIVNSDKMQVYKGLDIVTNKIKEEEKRGVPHHLLGVVNPDVDYTAERFCESASYSIDSILRKGLLPIIVGGSNSYIEALVDGEEYKLRSKYDCCFIWIDVLMPVLHEFVSKRVDQMVGSGMLDEVRNFFNPHADYSRGIRRSIGVAEFDKYLRAEPFSDRKRRTTLLQEAINETKQNTRKLACRQLQKIHRLRDVKGWNIHRINATEVFCLKGKEADEKWDKLVAQPSANIVRQFLNNASTKVTNSPPVRQISFGNIMFPNHFAWLK